MPTNGDRPALLVDVDGVISLYGFRPKDPPPGRFHWIDGVAHCIPEDVGQRLVTLADSFELVWATGWEERANEHPVSSPSDGRMRRPGLVPQHVQGSGHVLCFGTPGHFAIGRKYETSIGPGTGQLGPGDRCAAETPPSS